MLWGAVQPLYERWKKDRTIVRDGLMLDAWGMFTKGQIKACNDLGMFTVEDIATATDSIRQKLGIGASDMMAKAKAVMANKEGAAQAAIIARLEATVEAQSKMLEEMRETNDALAAEARHLLVGSEEPGSFAVRYAKAREHAPAVAAAHAEISKSLN